MKYTASLQMALALTVTCFLPSATLLAGSHKTSGDSGMKENTVKLVSATNVLGYDVFDKEGKKVGDMANFVLDLSEAPRLTHVIVMTGGFLNVGGTNRAVPAKALSWNGERYVLPVDRATFEDAPVLPDNLERFFGRASNLKQLAKNFDVKPMSIDGDILFFDELDFHNIESTESGIIGYLTDVYLTVDHELTPYLIMAPTDPMLDTNTLSRYAIPTTAFVEADDPDLVFDITIEDLLTAGMVESTDGIKAELADRGLAYKLDISQ